MIDKNTFKLSNISNRKKILLDFLSKKEKTSGMPLEIGIEIINVCNLRCIMCPYSEMVEKNIRTQGKMNFKLFKKIIDEVANFAELVYLHGLGEPLLHPRIFEYIEYAKDKNLKVGISTNATLLNKDKTKKLLRTKIDYIIFAVDGAKKETYEGIRVGSNFEKVEKNINSFLQLKSESKHQPFVVIQFISMEENKNEESLFLKRWQKSGVDVVRIKPKITLKKRDKKVKTAPRPYCFHIFRLLNIFYDGTVLPCCEDVHGHYALGNIKKTSLKKLWNSPKMQFLRKINFSKQGYKVAICKSCTYPQPSIGQAMGVLILDHLTIKKILPRFEYLIGNHE